MKLSKRGQVFDNLASLSVGIATFSIIIIVAFLVMSNVKTQLTADSSACANGTWNGTVCCYTGVATCLGENQSARNSLAWNSTGDLQNTTSTVPGWIPLIVIVTIGSIILGMIGMFRK